MESVGISTLIHLRQQKKLRKSLDFDSLWSSDVQKDRSRDH